MDVITVLLESDKMFLHTPNGANGVLLKGFAVQVCPEFVNLCQTKMFINVVEEVVVSSVL